MFGILKNVYDSVVQPCTRNFFHGLLDNPRVEEICAALAENEKAYEEGRKTKKEHDDFKAKHKSLLPALLLQGTPKDGRRKSQAGYIPTGLAMMDYDRLPRPQEYFEQKVRPLLERPDTRICWVHVTPSGRGLRIVFRIPSGCPSIEAAQRWMGEQLGDTSYDACVKDITRLSFAVPRRYVLYLDEDLLFAEPEAQPEAPVSGESAPAPPPARQPAQQPAAPAKAYPATFHGEPLADIARRCATAGGEGEPEEGERHQRMLKVAGLMRYICGNDPNWLLQILPAYGLPPEEMKGIAEWACAQPLRPKRPQELEQALRPRPEDEELPGLPEKLPRLVDLLLSRTPDIYKAATAQALFPALATYVYQAYFLYIDGTPTGMGQMCLLIAPSSSGKGCVNAVIDRILVSIAAQDEENRRVEQQWKDEVNSKGANKDKRKRPKTRVQWVEPDMTNAVFVQRLMDADGHYIYTRMDEVKQFDALKGNVKTDGQFNIICLAFDESPYGQERVGTMSVSGRPHLRFNWNASTTIGQGKAYFRKVLINGPLTRLSLCTIPDQGIGADIPVYGTYDEAFDRQLRPYIENLRRATGRMECPEAYALAKRLNEECRQKAKELKSRAYDSFRKRAVLIAYRKACLLWLANGQRWEPETEDFVRWSLQYDLACKMRFFGRETEEEMSREMGYASLSYSASATLARLPEEFTYQDLVRARLAEGQSEKGAMDQLKQWKSRSKVEKVTSDKYETATFRKLN